MGTQLSIMHLKKKENDIFHMLLEHGADFTIKSSRGETVLHQAMQFILQNLDNYWGAIEEYVSYSEREKIYSFLDAIVSSRMYSKNMTNPINNYGISHFHIACLINDVEIVQLFLENGVSVNHAVNVDSPILSGYTPLHFSARYCSIDTLEILLDKGADESLKDAKGMNVLHLLVKRNIEIVDYISNKTDYKKYFEINKKMIKLLIMKSLDKDIQVVDDIGFSNFHAACTLQDVAIAKKILEQVSDINHSIDKDSTFWAGYTALHFAAHFDVETVLFLVNERADMLVRDCQGVTPLDIFLQKYDVCDLNLLIDSQPQWKNILFSDNKTKLIDFMNSMKTADEFKSFINKIGDINVFIPHSSSLWPGYTPLHLSVAFCNSTTCFNFYEDTYKLDVKKKGSISIIEMCLNANADVTIQDARGSTAVHLAFHHRRMDIVKFLLKSQVTICNPVDHNGLSHLHIACAIDSNVSTAVFTILLPNHTDTNIPLKSRFIIVRNNFFTYSMLIYANIGSTPLHVAVNAMKINIVQQLLKRGFDVYSKDIDNSTPVHYLLKFNTRDKSYLEQLGKLLFSGDIKDSVSNYGFSHLHVACYLKNEAAVKKLLDNGADVNATVTPGCLNNFPEMQLLSAYQKLIDKGTHSMSHCLKHVSSLHLSHRYANYTPLHFAIEEDIYNDEHYEIIDALLKGGANILAEKADGSVILYEILAGGNFKLKEVFITEIKRNGKWQEMIEKDTGITLLHLACAVFDFDTVEQLLKNDVDVNARCNPESPVWPSCSPLHVLMISINQMGVSTIVKMPLKKKIDTMIISLLDYGADLTLKNSQHRTPIHQSVEIQGYGPPNFYTDFHFTNILLEYHEDFHDNSTDDRGISHFHIACMTNTMKAVESLLKNGIDVDQAIDFHLNHYGGYTPLHFAVTHHSSYLTRLLLQHNADVNARDRQMETPLHIAFGSQSLYKCHFKNLLEAGAQINEKNVWGLTPLGKLLKVETGTNLGFIADEIVYIITKYELCVNVFSPWSEEGFIGLALSIENYENVLDNFVLQAVIKAPQLNGADYFGRNIIHNVVSIWKDRSGRKLSTEDYAEIIEKLARLDFDIDQQDNKGLTPLHAAMKFENYDAVMGLLMNGADANIIDASGRVPYAHGKEKGFLESLNAGLYHKLFRKHFRKMSLFNLDINVLNTEIIAKKSINLFFYVSIEEEGTYDDLVIEESDKLKGVKIPPYSITLHHFMSETNLVASFPSMDKLKKDAIVEFFQTKGQFLRKNFPELTDILYLQYRKALARSSLIMAAANSLNTFTQLPYLCLENVLRYLKNSELKRVIDAGDNTNGTIQLNE